MESTHTDILSYVGVKTVSTTYVKFFFFQAEDGIRDLVRSRGLGDVYKRQVLVPAIQQAFQQLFSSAVEAKALTFQPTRPEFELSLIHI